MQRRDEPPRRRWEPRRRGRAGRGFCRVDRPQRSMRQAWLASRTAVWEGRHPPSVRRWGVETMAANVRTADSEPATEADRDGLRRVLYERVCESYHAVDDFRMKLLGLLPVAT